MYFGKNIKLLRKRKRLSQEDLAGELQIKRSSLSGYEIESSEPNFKTLLDFSNYFKISIDKLLKEDLNKLSDLYLSQLEKGIDVDITGGKLRVLATTVDSNNEENIELVPIKAKAGYATGYGDPEFLKILPTFQLPFLDRNKKFRTFQISGDSMPPVSEGSWVTAEYVQNWNNIKDGYPYIVVTKEEGIVFKILYKKTDANHSLELFSTNPEYKPYDVHINDVLEVWKFVNYISPEMSEASFSKNNLSKSIYELQKEVHEIKNTLRGKSLAK